MRNKELKSLNEAIAKVVNPQADQLDERKLDDQDNSDLKGYIDDIAMLSLDDGGYEKDIHFNYADDDQLPKVTDLLKKIEKQFGKKTADTIKKGLPKMKNRPSVQSGDKLAGRARIKPGITKKGKVNKRDADLLKSAIKRSLGINEDVIKEQPEQLNEGRGQKAIKAQFKTLQKVVDNVKKAFASAKGDVSKAIDDPAAAKQFAARLDEFFKEYDDSFDDLWGKLQNLELAIAAVEEAARQKK